jgi:hypothetical protein
MSALLALALAAPLLAAGPAPDAVHPAWRTATLPAQRLPVTQYRADAVDGRRALRIDADGSYGNLVQRLPAPTPVSGIAWSWRVAAMGDAIALRRKAGDDSPARVCLAFAWPDRRVPFIERQLLRLARARSGEPLPAATLCWAWGGAADMPGSLIENPYTRRVRTVVLRHAPQAGRAWHDEQRDVAADFRAAFGDEWPAGTVLPPATAVFVAGDADNTASRSTAWVADLNLR